MENYKKKYEDALKRAEAMIEVAANREEVINCVSTIFPEEFKESDEGIKEEIIHYFKDIIAYSEERKKYDNWIAWLEKQGEKKSADKTKPKFKVDDWIITKDKNVHKDYSVCKIVEIENDRYHLENGDYLDIDTLEQYDYHLWTIQDAVDGDVLQLGEVTAIFKKYIGDGNCKCYCSVYDGEFEIPNTDNSYGCHNAVPATKEQRYLLEKAMTYAGYTFDFEKKEIKLLISNGGDFEPELSHQEVTKKSEQDKWSEEDEKIFSGIYGFYNAVEDITLSYKKEVEWLKSIKERLMQ